MEYRGRRFQNYSLPWKGIWAGLGGWVASKTNVIGFPAQLRATWARLGEAEGRGGVERGSAAQPQAELPVASVASVAAHSECPHMHVCCVCECDVCDFVECM